MSVIKNNPERAEHYASQLKTQGNVSFDPAVTISFSESGAVSGLTQALALSTEVVTLFSQVATKEGDNITKLSNYWVTKDAEIAGGAN